MAIPVSVVCDRGGLSPLDLTPRIDEGTLNWSSVVPGGFASCGFQISGDFRRILKDIPYLSIIRVIGDSGRILFEGQVEDLSPTLSDSEVGLKVGAFGLQNVLKETSVREAWSLRNLTWNEDPTIVGVTDGTYELVYTPSQFSVQTGQFDPTNLSRVGVLVQGINNSGTTTAGYCNGAICLLPVGLYATYLYLDYVCDSMELVGESSPDGSSWANVFVEAPGSGNLSAVLTGNVSMLRMIGVATSGFAVTSDYSVAAQNMRVVTAGITEDSSLVGGGGYYGATLINSLLSFVPELGAGVIEAGTDFLVDHLDASVRRTTYDILTEISSYYSREWAVWDKALLDWTTPNLQQNQWIIPISKMVGLDLDASVVNSNRGVIVLYTDAASQVTAEASAASTDRRNPYVLNSRIKDLVHTDDLTMTANTAQQLASTILNDIGFGPVPASGTVVVEGDTIIQHAQGNARKAWEIRAGDNITIPELPMADIFTQDGRGEVLFHIISAEADEGAGTMTFTLDSYGSKRSDVLIARIAAVTSLLGG